MQNTRIARFFIETLTETSIEEVDLKPQEFVYTNEQRTLEVSRYDFIATIKTAEGENKKVLIEIQKARNAIDLMRFRRYLGEQYKIVDEVPTEYGSQRQPLPIIAIYLLGFNLPGLDPAAVKVARHYTDLFTHEVISQKSDFIERLSHDCYVIQMAKIQSRVRTSLDALLSVFEQNHFVNENGTIKEYNYEITNEVVKNMVDILHFVGTDPARKKEIEDEQEAWRTIGAMGGDKVRELEGRLQQKERALADKDKELEGKDKELEAERAAKENLAKELDELKRRLGGQ
jgi:hypothetical protein